MNSRFRDYTTCLSDFDKEVLIHCPQCDRRARSAYKEDAKSWQLTCLHCGYSKTSVGKIKRYGVSIDPVFHLPLWLQVPCCGEVLWAYNAAHLEWLEQYVQATLRERQGTKGNHHGIAVRLPRWMKLAKNRQAILKEIQSLRTQLES